MSVKIAGYLRISVDTEVDRDSTSIENQRKIIQDYVKDHFNDYELDFYEDRDRSGYTFTQREDYMRMRPQLMNGDYDILIIKDLSRFSRRNSRGLVELEDLRDAGVRIIAIGDGIDYPTHDDWQHIQVKFLVNEMPIQDASKKVRSVIDNRQKNGQWVCAVPYGYYITNTKTMAYIIDVSAIPVIQEIFDLYISGLGYKKIAEHLTLKKVPTPRMAEKLRKDKERELRGEPPTKIKAGEVWSGATIKEILVNDFYIGTLRQKKYTRKNINGKDVRVEENEQRVFEKWHEAIIDDRTFAKVQELLKTRSTNHYRGKKKYDTTYSGFLFCGDCKSPMFSMSRPDLAPAYTCGSYHKHGKKIDVGGCTSHHTRVDLLDTLLKRYIEQVKLNSKTMLGELEKAIKKAPKTEYDDTSALEKLSADLARANEEYKQNALRRDRAIDRAEKRFREEALDREIERIYETYDAIEDDLIKQMENLENQIKFLSEKRNAKIQINRIAKTAMDIFDDILNKDKLDKGDLALIVDRITVYESGNIEIQLKADITMLLETGKVSKELLETSSFVGGTAVNFNWDTKSILNAQVVQMVKNQKDKAFSVNVVWEGDPLEIYTEKDGGVIFRKYSPMGDLQEFAAQMCDAIGSGTGHMAAVADRDAIIALSGLPKRDLMDKPNSEELERLMEQRQHYRYAAGDAPVRVTDGVEKYHLGVASPILCQGDLMGCVMLLLGEHDEPLQESDQKLAQIAANFLGSQMEN